MVRLRVKDYINKLDLLSPGHGNAACFRRADSVALCIFCKGWQVSLSKTACRH